MAKRIIKPDSGNTLVLQEDNGSIDALTVETNGDVTLGGNLVIPDSGTIGSASANGAITIDSSGLLLVGATSVAAGVQNPPLGLYVEKSGTTSNSIVTIADSDPSPAGNYTLEIATPNDTTWTTKYEIAFTGSDGMHGSISSNGTSTAYNTSSDYRLKEDWQPMTGSIDRLKALNPVNFAWKVDGSRVDGFLAHEAQEVVPEAVTGEKDAVDADGNPEYQGIDLAKLVPLLTAALQEAVSKIEALETRILQLESK